MSKKLRSLLINIGITAAVFISSFFLMGAYDTSCTGANYAELHYDYNNFSGFEVTEGNIGKIVNIKQGAAASIPVKVIITMLNEYKLQDIYLTNEESSTTYGTASIDIGSGFNVSGISMGTTSRTDPTATQNTTGASFTLTANLELTSGVEKGDYNVPVVFKIYNNSKNELYTLDDTIHINVYDFEIATTYLQSGMVGESYNETLSLRGGIGPYAWSADTLPAGLNLDTSTGVISGTPETEENYWVTISAIDSSPTQKTATKGFDLVISTAPLSITTSSLPAGSVGNSYSVALEASGGKKPYTWSATGLPDGLNIDDSTGVISGTPTTMEGPTVTIQVTDSSAMPLTESVGLTLNINAIPLSITTTSLPHGRVGDPYNVTLGVSGGTGIYTWSADTVPVGLSINSSTGVISGTPTVAGTSTVHITVTDSNSDTSSADLSLTIDEQISNGGSGSHSAKPSQPDKPAAKGSIIETKVTEVNQNSGIAKTQSIDSATLDKAFENTDIDGEGRKTVSIIIPEKDGAKGYESGLPSGFWTSEDENRAVAIKTAIAEVTVPNNMLTQTEITDKGNLSLTVAAGDKTKLDTATQAQVGDRPIIEIALSVNGKQTAWSNENAPVTISIPYTPTAEELKDPEHITVWYIDGSGKAVSVPSGRYDAETGRVTFKTTHFSEYAVAFVQKIFNDLNRYGWAKKSIEVLASKGIVTGSSESSFNPSGKITRADFLVLLTKTLDLSADTRTNFSDVEPGKYYYEAVGTAKELGIVTGLDNNKFKPKELISRQDMMVMAYRALNIANTKTGKAVTDNLNQYADKAQISGYAVESVSSLINSGFISGSNGKLNPLSNTTRAEAAAFLYNLYNAK